MLKPPWRRVSLLKISIHYIAMSSNEETFLQNFLALLKHSFQNFLENLEEMFPQYYLSIMMSADISNLQPHSSV